MIAILAENLKFIMLFVLVGSIIHLSQLGARNNTPAHRERLRKFCRPASARLYGGLDVDCCP